MTCCVFFGLNLPSGPKLGRGRGLVTGRKTAILVRQALLLGLAFCFAITALSQTAAANPAQMISDFRLKHGEKRVTLDAALTRIAHDQAQAMAAKDQLDHDVLGRFNSRVSPAGARRAAEDIADCYYRFSQNLHQSIKFSRYPKKLPPARGTPVRVGSRYSAQ